MDWIGQRGPVIESEVKGVKREPDRARANRYGRRAVLHLWLGLLAVAAIFTVVLIVQNTKRVRVGWVFGHSHISLVYLVVFATLLGWLLGMATSVLVRRRTRRPLTAIESQATRGDTPMQSGHDGGEADAVR